MSEYLPTCQVCGVAIRDLELHERFHNGLTAMILVITGKTDVTLSDDVSAQLDAAADQLRQTPYAATSGS